VAISAHRWPQRENGSSLWHPSVLHPLSCERSHSSPHISCSTAADFATRRQFPLRQPGLGRFLPRRLHSPSVPLPAAHPPAPSDVAAGSGRWTPAGEPPSSPGLFWTPRSPLPGSGPAGRIGDQLPGQSQPSGVPGLPSLTLSDHLLPRSLAIRRIPWLVSRPRSGDCFAFDLCQSLLHRCFVDERLCPTTAGPESPRRNAY